MSIDGIINAVVWFFTNLPESFLQMDTPRKLAVIALCVAPICFYKWYTSPQRSQRRGGRRR